MERLNEMTTRFWISFRTWTEDQAGASMVEYGLLLAVIAVVALAAFQLIGSNLNTTMNDVAGNITS